MRGQHGLRQVTLTRALLVDKCNDRALCPVAHPEHEAHACDGPHVPCKRTGLGIFVAGIEVLARLDRLAQEAVRVYGRMLYCLGKIGERCLRRAIVRVPVPEASPQQCAIMSLGQLHQPAPQKGERVIPTERLVVQNQGGHCISRDMEGFYHFVSYSEDVADAVSARLVG